MNCAVLLNIHPMIGVDYHDTIVPPAPAIFPSPHFVAQILNGLNISVQSTLEKQVYAMNFPMINRGSDIGMGIGHVAANVLFPVHVLSSGSISEFGAFTVMVGNKPLATACMVYINLNLNCQGPGTLPVFPLPTGIVIAPNTVMAGMKPGDWIASVISLLLDAAIQGVLNYFFSGQERIGRGAGVLGKPFTKIFNKWIGPQLGRLMFKSNLIGTIWSPLIGHFVKELPGNMALMILGSPVGTSTNPNILDSIVGESGDNMLANVAEYFNEIPSVN